MTTTGVLRSAAAVLLVLALAACAEPAGGASADPTPEAPSPPGATPPEGPDSLVLRVELTGGYTSAQYLAGRMPRYSVYTDGRMITDGPVALVYPGSALPNVQVAQLDPEQVQGLIESALAAGVDETADLGSPTVTDMPSTRFTLATADRTYVREVYALSDLPDPTADSGLTDEQRTGREDLAGLLAALDELGQQEFAAGTPPQQYQPTTLAAVVAPWVDLEDGMTQPTVDWPGPPLPGDPLPTFPDLGCLAVSGDQLAAVLSAIENANAGTPWRSPDGGLWSISFRPLLPDETGCADLTS